MEKKQSSRPTLVDIAADAGVSRATVSLVLRNVPVVANTTRKRVLRSIGRLGYVYHRGAANLRQRRTLSVGLIVSDIANPFFAEIITAIEAYFEDAGFTTLFCNTSETYAKEDRVLKTMREFPADGILICPALGADASEKRALDIAGLTPVVAVARRVPGVDYAGVDNALGAEMAIDHLYRVGHRRIAFLGGDSQQSTGAERLRGYQKALAHWSLPFEPTLVVPSIPNRDGGFEGVQTLLNLGPRPTAALCFNDVVALGAMEALRRQGLRPGPDFGIVGFNNIPEASQTVAQLTTIDTSPRELGKVAAELLLKRIEQPEGSKQTVILQPRLVVRQSCGAAHPPSAIGSRASHSIERPL